MSEQTRPPFSDPEFARKAGRKGGAALAAKLRRRGIVLDELGALEDGNDLKRWLRMIAKGVLSGDLDRMDGDTSARILRTWLEAHGSAMAHQEIEALREELKDLRAKIGPRAA